MQRVRAAGAGLALVLLLLPGCDGSGPPDDDPAFKTLTSVEFAFEATFDAAVRQTIRFRRDASRDTFTTDGRVVLEPGDYAVRIKARDASGPLPDYMSTAGPSAARLYYALDAAIMPHAQLQGRTPPARSIDAVGRRMAHAKTTPALTYSFELTADSTAATGDVRLRLVRFERPHGEESGTPDHVDFDLRVPIRIVPPVTGAP
jgi:hypothetical protein